MGTKTAAVIVLGSIALRASLAAAATDDPVSGTYTVTWDNGATAKWTLTPCGSGCLDVRGGHGWSTHARFINDEWTFELHNVAAATRCADGNFERGDVFNSFDASATSGSSTSVSVGCGSSQPQVSAPLHFSMTKTQ